MIAITNHKWRWTGVGMAGAVVAIGLIVLFLRHPAGSARVADGTFVNDYCGAVELRDGRLFLDGVKSVRYTVGRDEKGPYILPAAFVATWEDRGFQVDGNRRPLKLRLDRVPGPTRITLWGPSRSYEFIAKTPDRDFRKQP